ncbi:trans-2,3-dihydro-3-hydroxyanthranilate isomerase [bacterium JGI 053]|nr:trans-2,3-dihydro-3-hydroxyanthranilate isomerase [bacterium JGI 053]
MPHRFVIADVFTETAFGGNQLAVLPDGRGLSERAMQSVAREFNFSETTFVLPPETPGTDFRLRIFTPAHELPFAGHPTVGTASVLARLGLVALRDGAATVVFGEGVGPVSVAIEVDDRRAFSRLSLQAAVEEPADRPTAEAAAALSLPADAVREAWFSTVGNPFCFVHVADREAVDRAEVDRAAWSRHFAGAFSDALFFFSGDLASGSRLYARMFAPGFGIDEDAATGSAAATLAGSLANRLPEREGVFTWTIDQGVKMGRPSLMEASAEKRDGAAVRVMAGGATVLVAEGTITVPDGI